jgi:hypothetical protein
MWECIRMDLWENMLWSHQQALDRVHWWAFVMIMLAAATVLSNCVAQLLKEDLYYRDIMCFRKKWFYEELVMVSFKMQLGIFALRPRKTSSQKHITEILSRYFHALYKMISNHTVKFYCVFHTSMACNKWNKLLYQDNWYPLQNRFLLNANP